MSCVRLCVCAASAGVNDKTASAAAAAAPVIGRCIDGIESLSALQAAATENSGR